MKNRKRIRRYFRFLYPQKDLSTWCLDKVIIEKDKVEIHGWAIPPKWASPDRENFGFAINNNVFQDTEYPIPRDDIGILFWDFPEAVNSGFRCKMDVAKNEVFSNGYAEFSFINKEIKKPIREEHNYYCFDFEMDGLIPIPDSERRFRVHGHSAREPFLIEGFTNYTKLKKIFQEKTGKTFTELASILDWGCGCGRLTRYLRNFDLTSITGVDIDVDNIQWCQDYLPFGQYVVIPPYPPTDLPDSAFDLIIGISVFTHLTEDNQLCWLKELHRISINGAILLLSVHGQESVIRANLPPDLLFSLKLKGFLDVGKNSDLGEKIDIKDYYRNVYHSQNYIKKKWGKYFEIIGVIPGCIGNMQDLIILRKK